MRLFKIALVFILSLFVSLHANMTSLMASQTDTKIPAAQASLEKSRQLVELMRSKATNTQMMRPLFYDNYQFVEKVTGGNQQAFKIFSDVIRNEVDRYPVYEDAAVQMYAEKFTDAELDEIIKFLQTQTGQKFSKQLFEISGSFYAHWIIDNTLQVRQKILVELQKNKIPIVVNQADESP